MSFETCEKQLASNSAGYFPLWSSARHLVRLNANKKTLEKDDNSAVAAFAFNPPSDPLMQHSAPPFGEDNDKTTLLLLEELEKGEQSTLLEKVPNNRDVAQPEEDDPLRHFVIPENVLLK